MTLGKKLSNHRKMLGWTQQQLGEHLNLSAQAISKWENNLAEPDLATLKSLAALYGVSIDELLDTSDKQASAPAPTPTTEERAESSKPAHEEKVVNQEPPMIGICKKCGIAITVKTLGSRSPLRCKSCVEQDHREQERAKQAEKAKLDSTKARLLSKKKSSLIVATIGTVAYLIAFLVFIISHFSVPNLIIGIALAYPVYSFIALLFYETAVTDVLEYMFTASIHWPGLIFTFDLDGIIWLISMKLLFAAIGFVFGIACAILGVILGLIVAPFVFPFTLARFNRDIAAGVVGDYITTY